jgi:hypothetical protein
MKNHRLPDVIQILAMKCAMKFPCTLSELEYARERFPQYWNKEGEFDPFFKKRGFIKLTLLKFLYRLNLATERMIMKLEGEY